MLSASIIWQGIKVEKAQKLAELELRVYKPPFTHTKAVEIITEGKGSHFDPDMVDAFLEVHEEIRMIAIEYADHDEEREALAQ